MSCSFRRTRKKIYANIIQMFFNRGSVSNFFQKASPIASNLFQKAKDVVQQVKEQAPDIVRQVSSGLGTAGRLLDQASIYGGKIASNPELQNINSPSLQKGLSLINRGSVLAGQGSKLAHSADTFTNPDTYKGGHEANLTQALQRAKSLKSQGEGVGEHGAILFK